jgi:hypothetical protein
VDHDAFVDCFLATILLRPEDGKIEDLSDANYLFESIDPEDPNSPLAPRMIDLEDSFPASNRINPDFEGTTHAVKTGLMGFPHVRQSLQPEQRERLEHKLDQILNNSKEALSELQNAGLSAAKQTAFSEVLTKIGLFLDKKRGSEYTMEDLFFFVFPEYAEQWALLEQVKLSPEEKASKIGNETVEFWQKRYDIKVP